MLKPRHLLLWLWKTLPLPRLAREVILWLGNPKFVVGVAGVVFDEAGRVLLLKHTYKVRHPWGLPAGFVGGHEDLRAALRRELQEETGLDIDVDMVCHAQRDPELRHVTVVFLCHHRGGTFQPNAEIAEMGFFALDALPYGSVPGMLPVLAQAHILYRLRLGSGV